MVASPFKKTNINAVRNVHEGGAAILNPHTVATAPLWLREGGTRPPAAEMVAFHNGLLHIKTGEWCDSTPDFLTLNVLPYDYQPAAPAPAQWLKSPDEVLPGDAESQRTLQEMFGYILLPDTSLQKFFLLIGKKRGGKGTVARTLSALIGNDNVVGTTLNSLGGTFGLEGLPDKLLWTVADMRIG